MKTIEEEIDEYFVRPLTKIFDGGEAPEGWDIRAKAEEYNRSFHDQMWMIKFHHRMKPIYWRLLSGDYSESTDFSDLYIERRYFLFVTYLIISRYRKTQT